MGNIWEITRQTVREAFARKIFIMFAGVSSFILLLTAIIFLSVGVDSFNVSMHVNGVNASPGSSLIEDMVMGIKATTLIPLFGLGLFLSIFSASSFIPSMLEKGNIDLLLSKPIARSQIIAGKFLGGITIVLFNIAYLIGGLWLLLGIKFGVWDTGFLMSIFTITYAFAVLYSLIILVGILFQSSILAMMISYLVFIVLSPILNSRDWIVMLTKSQIVEWILNIFYYIVPKTAELGGMSLDLSVGSTIYDYQPIWTSGIFMILCLAASIIIFSKKDY